MFARKMLGDKTKGGFYKKSRDAKGKRVIKSLDLETLEYRERRKPAFAEFAEIAKIGNLSQRVAAALRAEGRGGDFLRRVYLTLMNYSAHRVGEICETPREIDDAMCWGYGWKLGPFGLWDAVGLGWGIEQLRAMGQEPAPAALELLERGGPEATWYGTSDAGPTVFVAGRGSEAIKTPEGMLLLKNPATRSVLASNRSASLLDIGDGIACVEFHCRKMNVLNDDVMAMLGQALPTLADKGGFRGLVIGNQAENFCAGADLRGILKAATEKNFDALNEAVSGLQNLLMDLRHAPMPVVVAAQGMALGGGVEVAMHGDAIQASSELYMGLVEAGVGLLPAGGGLKELCRRASAWARQVPGTDPYPFIRRAFDCVGSGKVSSSADEARGFGFLGASDRITFHRNRVIADAKQVAIGLAEAGYTPPDRNELIDVIGEPQGVSFLLGANMFAWGGYISEHDHLIGKKIAHVLSGGMPATATKVTAQCLLDLEREAFVSLAGEEKTRARIEHMLKTGKPLRN
ncbi:MAG: enoyl-CoA hydratase-related protein, partial [Nannocystaceae bacterium]